MTPDRPGEAPRPASPPRLSSGARERLAAALAAWIAARAEVRARRDAAREVG